LSCFGKGEAARGNRLVKRSYFFRRKKKLTVEIFLRELLKTNTYKNNCNKETRKKIQPLAALQAVNAQTAQSY